jgi:hypothetical protein
VFVHAVLAERLAVIGRDDDDGVLPPRFRAREVE